MCDFCDDDFDEIDDDYNDDQDYEAEEDEIYDDADYAAEVEEDSANEHEDAQLFPRGEPFLQGRFPFFPEEDNPLRNEPKFTAFEPRSQFLRSWTGGHGLTHLPPGENRFSSRFSFGQGQEEEQEVEQESEESNFSSKTEQGSEDDAENKRTCGSNNIGFGKTVGGWGWTYARCDHSGCKCERYHGNREGGYNCTECGHPFEHHH